MTLPYTYEILSAANERHHGTFIVRGTHANYEVRLMAQAGLVKASLDDGRNGSFTSIDEVTSAGQIFLRAFKDHPLPDETTVEATWKVNSSLFSPEAA